MRVLFVSGSFPPMPCGVGDYTDRLVRALGAVTDTTLGVLTGPSARGSAELAGRAEVLPLMSSWTVSALPAFMKALRDWKPDIVHVQYPTQGYGNGRLPWIIPLVVHLAGRRVVQTWHEGYGLRSLPELLLKLIVPGEVIVVRPSYRDLLRPLLRWLVRGKTLHHIPNAANLPSADIDEPARQAVRVRYLNGQKRLVVFFGFIYPHKGVELLFDVCNPDTDRIVIAGRFAGDPAYRELIEHCVNSPRWEGRAALAGYLTDAESAQLLAAADAVILPFRTGGGDWNTTAHAAAMQGTFVLTTARISTGYDPELNTYFAAIDNVAELRAGLDRHAGTRTPGKAAAVAVQWKSIAARHRAIYDGMMPR